MATKKIRVGAQLYTLRDHLREADKLAATFHRLRKCGYDSAQISGVTAPVTPAELRKVMMDEGIEPLGAHVGIAEMRESVQKVIDNCGDWGVKYVAIPWLDCTTLQDALAWTKLGREVESLAKTFAKAGIVLQYHNHMFEFQKIGVQRGRGGRTGYALLMNTAKSLQLEPDFGWFARAGQPLLNWIEKLSGRMDQVHFKDWSVINGNEVTWRAVGEGGIDWGRLIAPCKKAGTHTIFVEQDTCELTKDPFLSLRISRENLAKLGV